MVCVLSVDFQNDYKTLYPSYMESIWWVFSELWNKGLVYRGVKVMPYSTKCNTPLSNFESGQNYKEVVDPAGTEKLYVGTVKFDYISGFYQSNFPTKYFIIPSRILSATNLCITSKISEISV